MMVPGNKSNVAVRGVSMANNKGGGSMKKVDDSSMKYMSPVPAGKGVKTLSEGVAPTVCGQNKGK